MRIVVNEFMSLDGVVQAPGGPDEDVDGGFAHGGWSMQYFGAEVMGAAIDEGMSTADALLFGRRTWQGMAAAWPERAGDPYAGQMNALKKYVASRTLTTHDDVTVPHDVAEQRIAAALAAGGTVVSAEGAPAFWVLADPEGNEACICTWQGRD